MSNPIKVAALVGVVVAGTAWFALGQADAPRLLPSPVLDERANGDHETAVLAGGCFWGMQGVFEHVKGVTRVLSGYAGGERDMAEYETVSTGKTGHAESIEITFNPRIISYGQILRVYFSVAHDPTELNRQGPDEGTQYRSEIFFTSPTQQRIASAYIAQLSQAHAFSADIVTRVEALRGFYAAEAYHQDYLIHHPESLYIRVNDLPKVARLRQLYSGLYRNTPVTVLSGR